MTNSHKKLCDSNGLYFEPALPPAWNLLQVPALLSVATMDYDWLWVILAVGVLAPVGVAPFALARDACCWWRDHRRGRREREMAVRQLWEG